MIYSVEIRDSLGVFLLNFLNTEIEMHMSYVICGQNLIRKMKNIKFWKILKNLKINEKYLKILKINLHGFQYQPPLNDSYIGPYLLTVILSLIISNDDCISQIVTLMRMYNVWKTSKW